MELPERAATVSRMLSRLDAIIRSEIAAVEIREQQVKEGAKERVKERKDERKWLRRRIASVLSFAGVLLGSLQTFFRMNVKLVNETGFDWGRYLYVYVVAGILALSPLISYLVLGGLRSRRERKQTTSDIDRESQTEAATVEHRVDQVLADSM